MTNVADAGAGRTTMPWREKPAADAKFYLAIALVCLLFIVAGFAPSFYLKPLIKAPPPLSQLTIVHGVVFTAWMALFITQATLVTRNNFALHRRLGVMGALLFGAMIALGFSTAITAGRLGHVPPGAPEPLLFMALPVISFAVTSLLGAGAFWLRHRPDWHKRLMIITLISMTGPGTGRIAIPLGLASEATWISVVITEILLAACITWDWRNHKRVHPAYLVGAAGFALIHVALLWAFSGAPAWLAFARALTGQTP